MLCTALASFVAGIVLNAIGAAAAEETEGQIRTAYPHEAKEPFSLVETRLDGFLTDSEVQALLTTLTRAA